MKSFVVACAVIALVAFAAPYALERAGFSTAERSAERASVRLD